MDPNETLKNLKHDVWLLSHLDVADGTDESLVELCGRVHESVEVELPTGGTIEERFAVAFGDKIHSYDEVARMKRRAPRAASSR